MMIIKKRGKEHYYSLLKINIITLAIDPIAVASSDKSKISVIMPTLPAATAAKKRMLKKHSPAKNSIKFILNHKIII